jgi:hypothetical protein
LTKNPEAHGRCVEALADLRIFSDRTVECQLCGYAGDRLTRLRHFRGSKQFFKQPKLLTGTKRYDSCVRYSTRGWSGTSKFRSAPHCSLEAGQIRYTPRTQCRYDHLEVPDRKMSGGEGGILLPPFLLSRCDPYTSAIIPCALAGYKRIRSSATVSTVSLIPCSSAQNGIIGISPARTSAGESSCVFIRA